MDDLIAINNHLAKTPGMDVDMTIDRRAPIEEQLDQAWDNISAFNKELRKLIKRNMVPPEQKLPEPVAKPVSPVLKPLSPPRPSSPPRVLDSERLEQLLKLADQAETVIKNRQISTYTYNTFPGLLKEYYDPGTITVEHYNDEDYPINGTYTEEEPGYIRKYFPEGEVATLRKLQVQSIIANLLVGRKIYWPWMYEYSNTILYDLIAYIRGQQDGIKINQDREKLMNKLTPENRALIQAYEKGKLAQVSGHVIPQLASIVQGY